MLLSSVCISERERERLVRGSGPKFVPPPLGRQTDITVFFMFAPCINSIKALFIIPTDAHNYKIIEMLKTIKIPTIAPTCFDSHRNHHQGAILCLAKTIIMILLCSSLAKHEIAP